MKNFFYIVKVIESCNLPIQLEACRTIISWYKEPQGRKLLMSRWEDKLHRLENYDLRQRVV